MTWTKQETDTMLQNLHIKPSVLSGIMPNKTTKQISRMRSSIMKKPPTGAAWLRSAYESLQKRRWSMEECSHYINAVRGNRGSVEFLNQRGLWYVGSFA